MKLGEIGREPSVEEGTLFGRWHFRWQAVVLVLVVLALVVTRLWDLGNHSYSHDEAIHAWESWKVATSQRYVHDPVYHGPFLYHWTALFFTLFGINDVTARLGAALLAVALVLLVWPLRRWLGRNGAMFAMILLTISPTMMFRSRFIRHDVVVMVPTIAMLICLFRYLEDRNPRWLYITAAALSIAFCGKANAYINGFILGSFFVLYLFVEWFRTRMPLREMLASPQMRAVVDIVLLLGTLALPMASPVVIKALRFNPLDYSQIGLIRSTLIVVAMLAAGASIGLWWNQNVWLISASIYYIIFIVLYTSLFTNAQGFATGVVGMLGYWLGQQDVARGGQPWYYYFFLQTVYEFLPLLLSGLGTVYYLVRQWKGRPRNAEPTEAELTGGRACTPITTSALFAAFVVYWTLLNAFLFAWSSEKMPWQNQHPTLALCILGGWFLGQVWDRADWRKMLQQGAGRVAILLPAAFFSLLLLVATTYGMPRPFSGKTLEQLQITLRWLLALMAFLATVGLMWRYARQGSERANWLDRAGWSRVLFVALVLVLGAATLRTSLRLSFVNQDYATEFLVYAASTPDTGAVTRELEDLSRKLVGDRDLKIAYDNESSWPFVWYLRDFKSTSFFADAAPAGDVQAIIVGPGNESKIKSQIAGKYLRREYRLIWWPNQDVYSNLTPAKLWKDLRDPARRQFWWDILWWRKYPQPTTLWPYVQRFALYVRKDMAAQLWDYGPEIAGPGIELPEDEYEKKRVELKAVASWGGYGTGPGQMNYPKGVAIDAAGDIYVADSYNHRVQVFDGNGVFLRQWGAAGAAPGQFQEPWGIAVDAQRNVYVADTWNHRIQKFDAQGTFLKQWGFFEDLAGALGEGYALYGPRSVAVDQEGNLLVSDTGNKRILKFTADGGFLQQWGGVGSAEGQFREPVGVALDAVGNVYVADTWNQRIQKLDASLNYVAQWPVLGWEGEGVTNKPFLAVDSQGAVYVTAPDYHWVAKYDGTGKVLAVWGRFGSDLETFNMPAGIAVDSADNVLVLDSANHRLLKFAAVR
jgi:uncharacterized protein (TIGR03663 family)